MVTISALEADVDALSRVLNCFKWKKHHIEEALALLRSRQGVTQQDQKERLLMSYRDSAWQ